jgi:hypothetical protein
LYIALISILRGVIITNLVHRLLEVPVNPITHVHILLVQLLQREGLQLIIIVGLLLSLRPVMLQDQLDGELLILNCMLKEGNETLGQLVGLEELSSKGEGESDELPVDVLALTLELLKGLRAGCEGLFEVIVLFDEVVLHVFELEDLLVDQGVFEDLIFVALGVRNEN